MLQQTICVNRIKTAVQPHWDKPKELDFDCTITDSTVARAVAYRAGGGGGGHGPRAQGLEGAPAQLVGANFNGANAMGPELSRAPISLGVFFVLKTFFFFFFFFGLSIFSPTIGPRALETLGTPLQ